MKKIFLFISLFISVFSFGQSTKSIFHVKFATTRSLPANSYSGDVITGTNNADTLWVDGFKVSVGDKILVNNEATAANNGIYVLTQQAAAALPFILKRADYSSTAPNLITSSQVTVQYGKIYAGYVFNLQTQGGITIGTTGLVYATNKNYLDKGFPPANGFTVVGTSIEAGFCAGCSGGTTKPWPDYLAGMLGVTSYNNYAVASTGPRRACYAIALNQGAQKTAALLSGANFNYVRLPISGDTTHRFGMVKSANHRLAALQFTNSIIFYRSGASGTVTSGITTSQSAKTGLVIDTLKDFCSAAVYYQLSDASNAGMNVWWTTSTVANETITIPNVAGSNLGIGVAGFSLVAPASRVQVTVDGSVVTTYDPNDRTIDTDLENAFFHRQGFIPDEIIITGLRDTLHTVVLTYLDGSKIGYFDHIASLKTPAMAITTPFYILDNLYMNSTGYNLNGAQAMTLDSASNSIRADMTSILPSYPIFFANANYPSGLYNPTDAQQTQTDGVHPWENGPANIATSFLNSINLKIPASFLYGIGSSVYNSTAGSVPYFGTGGILRQSNSKFFWDSTNNRLGIGTNAPTTDLHVKRSFSGFLETRTENTNSAGQAGFQAVNDLGNGVSFRIRGSAAGAAYGSYVNNSGLIYSPLPFGIMVDAANDFWIATGSGAPAPERFRISSTGLVTPGATVAQDFGSASLLWRDIYIRGIVGVITNSNAQTGSVGEYVTSLVAIGAPISLSNNTAANATSISLTAGDWDVDGQVSFTETASTVTARSAGISSTTATVPSDGSEAYCGVQSTVTSETNSISLVKKRFSLSGTTTIFLVGKASFSAGSCGIFGVISARRVR
jgi:hypothetical protein